MNFRCKECKAEFADYYLREECPHCDSESLEIFHPKLQVAPDLQKEVISSGMMDRGFQYNRVNHNERERAFAEEWEKKNRPVGGVNFGQGILQDLFFERLKEGLGRTKCNIIINDTSRYIVATVIQWLGSNSGMSFLQEALRKCGYRVEKIDEEIS